jgi:RNA polymerase sigma factor (sigma-70 family)
MQTFQTTRGLSREEERRLGERIQTGDEAARNELVEANRGFAYAYAADSCKRYGVDFDECVSACETGLVWAAERFLPQRGVKFCTYAAFWMRNFVSILARERGPASRDAPKGTLLPDAVYGAMSVVDVMNRISDPHAVDPGDGAALAERREAVAKAVEALDDRSRRVLYARFWQGRTLKQCGRDLGLSKERVRQIEFRALEQLGEDLSAYAGDAR